MHIWYNKDDEALIVLPQTPFEMDMIDDNFSGSLLCTPIIEEKRVIALKIKPDFSLANTSNTKPTITEEEINEMYKEVTNE